MEKKQLNEQELQQLKDLQSGYSKIYFELGNLEFQKRNLEEVLEKIKTDQSYLILDSKTIRQKEEEFAKELNEKYGKGSIDINTGEITPLVQP